MKNWLMGLSIGMAAATATAGAAPDAGASSATAAPVAQSATAFPTAQSAVESPVTLETRSGKIHGTLLLPGMTARVPVVLLIAGSGPTDRDGNSRLLPGPNNSLKLLAEALAQAGFASLRYDKRGVAESAPALAREADVRFETYVQDAVGWARQLADDPRFSAVAIVGHSEGSLIGMLAAQQAKTAAFVSIAGIGRPGPRVLRAQLAGRLTPELAERHEQILHELEAGRSTDDVPQALAMFYRPSVQPYLISLYRYVPTTEIARLTMPVAIFQGTTDIQLTDEDAKLLATAGRDARLNLIFGMNHVLKIVPPDRMRQLASYSDPTLPLSPELARQLPAFLRGALQADGPPR